MYGYDGDGLVVSEELPGGGSRSCAYAGYDAAGLPVEVVETAARLRAILPPRQQGSGGVAEGSLGAWVGECGATS